uniref:1-phosphatidylinositol 4,5-bisphosphate phosphodiesterase beta-1-like isoform X2 n=2 Tax=Myxine glutinosa TaxID=7769 RepID=UPI00358E687D
MAGAQPGVHSLQLEPIRVPESLKRGNKFLKWEEDGTAFSPVTLMVDPHGYFLYWMDQSKETDCLEITSIRDTRNGKYAKTPKNAVLREAIEKITGSGMEKDTVTVVTGPDLVNLVFLNFTCVVADKAQEWTNELFTLGTNLLAQNASRKTFLLKAYTKLTLQLTAEEKISVKHIYKMFPADKKRVETALSNCGTGLPCGRNDSIPLSSFSPEVFLTFIHHLCPRTDTDSIFAECGAKNKPYMTVEQFTDFTNNKQRDPRLNEVLFPPLKPHQVQQLIEKYEPNSASVSRGQLSVAGFLHFLNGEENGIVPPEKLDLYEDMTHPLSHYFINSSHNTYLTAGQLKGNSSVEMYRQALIAGCRCIELDCWKGRMAEEEPIITHGFTMTTEIPFKDVIDAIAESAFKTSPYPVILSFENHVDSPKQQAKMAEYCRQAFGDKLLIDPLDRYPLEPGIPLPNPEELKFKILVKNKKKSINKDSKKRLEEVPSNTPSDCSTGENQSCSDGAEGTLSPVNSMNGPDRSKAMDWQKSSAFKKSIVDDLDAGSDDDDYTEEELKKVTSDEGTASKEVGASEEMSNLVNYIQPMKFNSFEESRKNNMSFLMSSFVETKGLEQLTKSPVEFVEYNKTQLSRIYPKGTRVDSSNYMPQVFWNAGCQMVALNYQSLDLPMQLNMGIFEYNCKCGYLLKPEFMRRPDKHFDPFTCNTIDGIIANTFSVKLISGQFLSDKKVGTFVEVEMYGLPVDTKRKMYKTRTSKENNSISPVWDEDPFVFKKVVLPGLASLRIAVFEEGGKFIGHRILPVSAVRPGFHHISLRNESNQPLMLPSVFVFIEVKDYVPDAYEDIIQGLSNPIKYQSEMEERARQLEALTMEESDARIGNATPEAVVSQPKTPILPSSYVKSISIESPLGNGRAQDQRKMSRCSLSTYDLPCSLDMTCPRRDSIAEVMQDVEPLTLEILRRNKSFLKLLRRQEKELQEMRRKHNKRGEEIQRTMDTIKRKQTFKNRRTNNIELEKSRQLSGIREEQQNELLVMRQDQLQVEHKKRELHQCQLCEKLLEISQEMNVGRMKKMKDVCEKEQKDLKKQMNAAVKEQLDSVSKELKDKVQVERQKEQIHARFISDAVGKYKALEESQIKRQEMLDQRFQQLQQQIRLESKRQKQELQEQYEAFQEDLPKLVMNFMRRDVRGSICDELGLFPPSLELAMSFCDVDEDGISGTQL